MTPVERRNAATIRKVYQGYDRTESTPERRLAAVLAPVGDDTVYVEHAPREKMAWGGIYEGRDGVLAFLERISAELEHEAFTCEGVVARGPWVFAWGRLRTRCRKTGRRSEAEWQHRIRMKGGRIVEWHEFYDTLRSAMDLGRL
ncbi:MAG: nuclear transport factor 2 family protein [Reyranellaceae bacterium]